MFRLLTFGGLALEPNGTPVTPRLRPPRLALLAVVAAAGDRGVTRDRLVTLFWPDADEDHGRHSLRQALYALKNEAGQDLVHAGPALQLNPQALKSDIEEFRSALACGDRRRAAELYRGPFLDGFYLSGSSEFERWVEQERTRLAEAITSALLELATEAAAAGHHAESARWWQQLTLLEPLSGRLALGHAHALAASGDRSHALAVIRAYETLIRRELEVELDPELRRLALQIRSQPEPRRQPDKGDSSVGEPSDPGPRASAHTSPARAQSRSRRRTALIAAGVLSVAALLGTREVLSRPAEPVASVLERPYTNSLIAARLYEEGLRAYTIRDIVAARRLMRSALREDSTFAMAAYMAAKALDQPEFEVRQRALRLAVGAPERERLLIMADLLSGNMEPDALRIAEEAAARYPTEPGIQMALAFARSTAGQWDGAVAAFERVLALSRRPSADQREHCTACDALGDLAQVYWWWDSLPAVARTAGRYLEMAPTDGWPWALLAEVSARSGDSAGALAHLRKHSAAAPTPLPPNEELTILLTLEQYESVEQVVQPLLASAREDESGLGRWMMFIALRNQGQLHDAELLLRTGRIGTSTPVPAVPLRVEHLHEALIALESGNPRRAAAFFDLLRVNQNRQAPGQMARGRAWNTLLMGTALAAAGDTAAVRQLADTVQYWGERSLFGRDRKGHHFLRGLLFAAQGRDEEAVASYRAAVHSWSFGYSRVNYELGRALLRLGRPVEAVQALQPALRGSIDASNLYITRTELHELLAQAFDEAGQPDSAVAHYRAVVQAWRQADARFVPRRLAAESRLGLLAERSRARPARRSASRLSAAATPQ